MHISDSTEHILHTCMYVQECKRHSFWMDYICRGRRKGLNWPNFFLFIGLKLEWDIFTPLNDHFCRIKRFTALWVRMVGWLVGESEWGVRCGKVHQPTTLKLLFMPLFFCIYSQSFRHCVKKTPGIGCRYPLIFHAVCDIAHIIVYRVGQKDPHFLLVRV